MAFRECHFYVYILASRSRDLYVGFTNNIFMRIAQHHEKRPGTYTARYNIDRLVHYEHFQYVRNAIARETEIKDWGREKENSFDRTIQSNLARSSRRPVTLLVPP
jgi:putative endonuclease